MKNLCFIICSLLITSSSLYSQFVEFKVHENGLIYSPTTMSQLEHIVDSLNLKFKSCDLSKQFYSQPQAIAHLISSKKNAAEISNDMKNNLPFDELLIKYPDLSIKKNRLILKRIENGKDGKTLHFSKVALNFGYNFGFNNISISEQQENSQFTAFSTDKTKNKYVYSIEDGEIESYYFIENFKTDPLENKYSAQVQYVDCLVDTTHHIFFEGASYGYGFRNGDNDKQESIAEDLLKKSRDSTKNTTNSPKFKKSLEKAYSVAIKTKKSNIFLEILAYKHLSPSKALNLKRYRRVMGQCSQDNSPRKHALDIAVLSAEAISWEIFLRAHLDIMNDRFHRASDGSYALEGRKTYIKEIEELGINVDDLLIGACISISNPSSNHYFGNIGRIGRALSESNNLEMFEEKILSAISDKKLDLLNRINMHFLYRVYCHNLEDKDVKKLKLEKLQNAVNTLPDSISKQITLKKEE
jgi:hypothetical protein